MSGCDAGGDRIEAAEAAASASAAAPPVVIPAAWMGLEHGQHQHTWRMLFFTFFMFFTFFTLVERQFICGRGCSRHARGWWLGWAVRRKRRMLRHAAPSSAAVAVAISCDVAVSRAVPAAIVSELDWRAIAPATRTSMSICASLRLALICASLTAAKTRGARDSGLATRGRQAMRLTIERGAPCARA